MHPADWLRRQQSQNEPAYNPSGYNSYNAYYGTSSSAAYSSAYPEPPDYEQSSNVPVDPKYAYIYNSFKPDRKTKFATFRASLHNNNGRSASEHDFEAERPSFQGAPPPISDAVKSVIEQRKERYLKMMRKESESDDVMEIGYESEEGTRSSGPSEATIITRLNEEYATVLKLTNMTSEMRINRLITAIKNTLGMMKVPPYEYQQYVETFVSRMIAEKKWTSLTVSTAVFLTVAQPVRVEEEIPNAWFKCMMCKYAYPPGEFCCSRCGQKFKSKPDLYVHEFEHHGCLPDEHTQCEVCGTVFYKNPLALRSHFQLNHVCQFEHLECLFGCKTLVLGTHSRALAEHVYSCHACIECNDLLSGPLEKHLEIFHSTCTPQSPPVEAPREREKDLPPPKVMSFDFSARSKRQRSPSPEMASGRKRMVRDGGTTFEEARGLIENLMDDHGQESNTLSKRTSAMEFLTQRSSSYSTEVDTMRHKIGDRLGSEKGNSNKAPLALEDEINMMFANKASKAPVYSTSSRSDLKLSSYFGTSVESRQRDVKREFQFEDISAADPFSTRTLASRQRVVELATNASREESPPNEIHQLEDENANAINRGRARAIGRSNLYAEEFVPRGGILTTRLPVYKDGLYYRGSPPRDLSLVSDVRSRSAMSRARSRSRSNRRQELVRNKSPMRRPISPDINVKYDKYMGSSPTRDSAIGRSKLSDKSKTTTRAESKSKSRTTQCRLCHFVCPADGGHTCRICKKQFLMETKLAIHMSAAHQLRVPMDLKCSYCQQKLADVRALHNHLLDQHLCNGGEHYQCSYGCDMLFSKDNYKLHLENKHSRYFCDLCEKDFSTAKKSHNCKPKKKPGVDKETLSKIMDEADGVFSDDELKIVQVNESKSMFAEAKDEIIVLSMAPCDNAPKLHVKKNRIGVNNAEVTRAMIQSANKDEFKRKGLFYCNKCPLVYNPTLKNCSKCDLLFFDAKYLALHAIEAHGCSMDMTDIGCDYCTEVFDSYEKVLNHRASHFCQEHVECLEGCLQLIVGRDQQLKIHKMEQHEEQQSSAGVLIYHGHISSDASAPESKDVLGSSADTIKCADCPMRIPKQFELICDKCSLDQQQTFYTQDELAYHLEKQHRISNKGDFHCTLCKEKSQSFKNDLPGVIAHKNKKHRVCRNHIKCPRRNCHTIMSRGKLETHLRKECDFVLDADYSIRPWFVYEQSQLKVCAKCDFGLHTIKLYKCTECDAVCADKYEFYAHLKLDHKKDELTRDLEYICPQCPGTASFSVSRWRQHRSDKHGYCENHFACPNMACDILVDSLSSLKKHLNASSECRNHPTIESSEFLGPKSCACCSQVKTETVSRTCVLCVNKNVLPFTDNTEYSMHLTYRHNKHVQTIGTIRCDTCKMSFSNFGDLGNHRIREHKICNKHTFCKRNKRCQFVFHFKEGNKPHACSENTKHTRNSKLAKKSKSGSKISVKLSEKHFWRCTDCNFITNPRPSVFYCRKDKCDKKFLTLNELSVHQVAKHKMTVSGNFQCLLCPGHPVFVDAPDKLMEHNSKTHDMCKFHKKCPKPGCHWLFNSEYDISRHMEWCLGIIKTAEELGLRTDRKGGRERSPRKAAEKLSRSSPKKEKKEAVFDCRDPVPEEGEVDERVNERHDMESKSKVKKLQGFSLLNCADCSKKFWIDSVFECTACKASVSIAEKQFLNKHELSAHLELKHNVTLSAAQQCSMCSEKFLQAADLLQHVKQVHHCCEMHFGCFKKDCQHVFGDLEKLVEHQKQQHNMKLAKEHDAGGSNDNVEQPEALIKGSDLDWEGKMCLETETISTAGSQPGLSLCADADELMSVGEGGGLDIEIDELTVFAGQDGSDERDGRSQGDMLELVSQESTCFVGVDDDAMENIHKQQHDPENAKLEDEKLEDISSQDTAERISQEGMQAADDTLSIHNDDEL